MPPASAPGAAGEGSSVGGLAAQQCSWIVAPLVEAGLAPERIRTLVFRLGFEAIVDDGPAVHERLTGLVRHEPPEVRAAWTAVIGRLIALDDDAGRI
jgi:hypothetical protein